MQGLVCQVCYPINERPRPDIFCVVVHQSENNLFSFHCRVIRKQKYFYFLAALGAEKRCLQLGICMCYLCYRKHNLRYTTKSSIFFLLRLFRASALCFIPLLFSGLCLLLLIFFMRLYFPFLYSNELKCKSLVQPASYIFSIAYFFFLIHVYFFLISLFIVRFCSCNLLYYCPLQNQCILILFVFLPWIVSDLFVILSSFMINYTQLVMPPALLQFLATAIKFSLQSD